MNKKDVKEAFIKRIKKEMWYSDIKAAECSENGEAMHMNAAWELIALGCDIGIFTDEEVRELKSR